MYNIDHFMIAANDLDRLSDYFSAATGIDPAPGGSHPDLGTHNRLIATTSQIYLELIAPNPALDSSSDLREGISKIDTSTLHRIIVRESLERFPAIVEAYRHAGVEATVRPLSRKAASGEVLRWHLLMPADGNAYGAFAPLFIDWGEATHPSSSLPAAPCTVVSCRASHPRPESVRALWKEIRFDLPVEEGPESRIEVLLDTPKGAVRFVSARAQEPRL